VVQTIVVKFAKQIPGDKQTSIGIKRAPFETDSSTSGLEASFCGNSVWQAQCGHFFEARRVDNMFP